LNIVINLRRKQLDGLVIYKYSMATSTQASSTSTSTRPSSTSTSTSTSNLYSSTTRVQVQVPSTTSLVFSIHTVHLFTRKTLIRRRSTRRPPQRPSLLAISSPVSHSFMRYTISRGSAHSSFSLDVGVAATPIPHSNPISLYTTIGKNFGLNFLGLSSKFVYTASFKIDKEKLNCLFCQH